MSNKIYSTYKTGFTLIELMIVIAIVAFLSMIALPNLKGFLAKAKRTEAYINLNSLATAEKAYFAEHGTYTKNLKKLGWKPEGQFNYTYGFTGSPGVNYYTGETDVPVSALSSAHASEDAFCICAAAAINGSQIDIICIDQQQKYTILQDALK